MKAITTLFSAAAALAVVGFATPSSAQLCSGSTAECALLGIGAGGAIGAAAGGQRGALTGLAIGGAIGAMQGMENDRRQTTTRRVYRTYDPAPRRTYRPAPRRVVSSQLTADVQYALTNLGYNPGPVDGVAGRGTAAAVRAYEADNGLLVTGSVTTQLLQHLRANGG